MSKPMSEQMQKLAARYEKATGKKFGDYITRRRALRKPDFVLAPTTSREGQQMITHKELRDARRDGRGSIHGWFWAYCRLNSSCCQCNHSVRTLCKLKNMIEALQTKIILHICKEGDHA